ncbi:hypothetical protein FRB97_006817 [Tulasnella sp. 331]|nr:hypothetical protein FRB97_006817 [Tulasnella sp. 331]
MFTFLDSLRAAAFYLTSSDVNYKVQDVVQSSQPLNEKSTSASMPDSASSTITAADVETSEKPPAKIKVSQHGIYTVWEEQYEWTDFVPCLEVWQNLAQFYASLPYFWRFLQDMYAQGPRLCILLLTVRLIEHVTPTLALLQASYMLNVRVDVQAKIAMVEESRSTGWQAFETFTSLMGLCLEIVLQGGFVYGSLRHQPGGTVITLLSLVIPGIGYFWEASGSKAYHFFITNTAYLRMAVLRRFAAKKDVKKEILGYAMAEHVQKEYAAARRELGDLETRNSWSETPPWSPVSLLRRLISESAVVVLAIKAYTSPETTPLTSLALLQQTTGAMESTLYRLFERTESVVEAFGQLKALYDIDDIENMIKDGTREYPSRDADGKQTDQGMKVEYRNVSFKYPNKDTAVINDLSFSLPASSICVIVGENGCGKSSTIKLLTRLYDVDDGEILIDDVPLKEYKVDDIRRATAIMHQDYHHFDLTLRENIGLGNVSRSDDLEAVKEASRLGQASDFIEKLPAGYDTSTRAGERPVSSWNVQKGGALDVMIKKRQDTELSFSGGEKQRLALSRTFMRSTTCDTRLLAYDEPSAALDPKAEFALFERLRNLRGNRTMIFVTHRFGYLTKYADLIIYMDKGKAVEQGSHAELLALGGQYAHSYNVQAQAFV